MTKEQAIAKASKLWRKWVAMDADGSWFGYTGKPIRSLEEWRGDGGTYLGAATPNWEDSLTEVDE